MSWLNYSFLSICLTLTMSLNAWSGEFTAKECLESEYVTGIKHEGKFFGLLKSSLYITKNKCLLDIKFKQILETNWLVDVCREPIHMKVTSKGSQDVYKRIRKCSKSSESDFCSFYNHLSEVMQDHGLIFAEGDRESLSTAHGQTYCAFLLLRQHLENGRLFSAYKDPISLKEITKSATLLKNDHKQNKNSMIPALNTAPESKSFQQAPAVSSPEDIF